MTIIAIDPGPTESAAVVYTDGSIVEHGKAPNARLLANLKDVGRHLADWLIIEKVASYGMPVGEEVFETVYWSGRFAEAFVGDSLRRKVDRIPRKTIVTNLCGSARAKDANVRQAIIDRFGGKAAAIGNKKYPGPLYGISGDCWQALACGLTWCDQQKMKGAAA
jgi:hypothetical protein